MTNEEYARLLHPKDRMELGLARELLESAGIPYMIDSSNRSKMLDVLEGQAAEGLRQVLVPRSLLAKAAALLEEAWGPDVFDASKLTD